MRPDILITKTEEEARMVVPQYPLRPIHGSYTPDQDLRLLIYLSQHTPGWPIVEVGCNTGITMAHLAMYNAPRMCYGFDVGAASGPQACESCVGHIGEHARGMDNAIICECEFGHFDINPPLGFVFIDGDHTYEGCKRDFETARRSVCERGIIAFHDYTRRDARHLAPDWVGVGRVVDEAEQILQKPFRHVHGTSVAYFVL